jgi:hypothetical protein
MHVFDEVTVPEEQLVSVEDLEDGEGRPLVGQVLLTDGEEADRLQPVKKRKHRWID